MSLGTTGSFLAILAGTFGWHRGGREGVNLTCKKIVKPSVGLFFANIADTTMTSDTRSTVLAATGTRDARV